MKIDFSYEKKTTKYTNGYFQKGKFYRCNYIKFKSLYKNPSKGTETVELYNFQPKGESKASALILHGLGTRNIKFILSMGPHLASFNVSCNILILPGNYTRVAKGSTSGKNYVYPNMKIMYNAWEHAIVDIRSTIDFLEEKSLWKEKNCILGYCLGGMLSTIATTLDSRIDETILMTTGGYFPKILHESSATKFARRMFKNDYTTEYFLHDKNKLYKTYNSQLPLVRKMDLNELLNTEEIHPLFKIDSLSYAHLLNKTKVTFIDAMYDEIIPLTSRGLLFKELNGSTRYLLPMTHGLWLPFEFILAQYVLFKFNIKGRTDLTKILPKNLQIPIISNFMEYFKKQ